MLHVLLISSSLTSLFLLCLTKCTAYLKLITQFSPAPYHFNRIRSKYSLQHTIPKYLQHVRWLRLNATNRKVAGSIPNTPIDLFRPMSTRNIKMLFLGSRALPARRDETSTAICEPIVKRVGSSTPHNATACCGDSVTFIYFCLITQLNSYLFTCKLNSPEASYRVGTSKEIGSTTKQYKQNKNWRIYI
jgi:hypothetical protein